jgi:hypothetical protein
MSVRLVQGLLLLTRAAQHQIDVLSHSYLCVQRDVNKSMYKQTEEEEGIGMLKPSTSSRE